MSEEDISNMKDPWLLDKSFNGISDEIFDDVIKFFDFPLEDVEANLAEEEDWDTQFKRIEEPAFDVFSVSSSDLYGKTQNRNPKLGRSFTASCNEASPIIPGAKTAKPNVLSSNKKDLPWFQTYSPVSVFESSSSSSGENPNFDLPVIPVKRPRGRRQRLSSFSPLLSIPFISSTTSPHFQKPQRNSVSESDFERQVNINNKVKRKPRRKDLSILSSDNTNVEKSSCEDSARKCMHCEVTKTPQWREGPMGPKTLCNACGVRYRSGRLFPEYRPAASPTFVPSMHSNSHKKVVEMRNKGNLGGTSIMGFAANSLG